jgi:transcriptional regulator with XRE-family HTH domain
MSEDSIVKGKADSMDGHVGKRLKMRRILLGLSQQDLGEAVNVSIQQIQKYEKATNRIASGKLYSLSKLLKVPVAYFFDSDEAPKNHLSFAEEQVSYEVDDNSATERELLALVRSYNDIKDQTLRKKVLDLVKTMSTTK